MLYRNGVWWLLAKAVMCTLHESVGFGDSCTRAGSSHEAKTLRCSHSAALVALAACTFRANYLPEENLGTHHLDLIQGKVLCHWHK